MYMSAAAEVKVVQKFRPVLKVGQPIRVGEFAAEALESPTESQPSNI